MASFFKLAAHTFILWSLLKAIELTFRMAILQFSTFNPFFPATYFLAEKSLKVRKERNKNPHNYEYWLQN